MRKKLLRSRSGFEKPESREEAIMQNILGASNVLEPSESNIEEILKSILYNTPYTKEAEFEIEKILLAIKNNGTYDGEVESRDMKILIAILNDLDYTEEAESRIEELFIEWLQQRQQIKVLEGVPPLTFPARGLPLINYLIEGNTTQNGTPTPDSPIMPQGTGERTGNLFDISSITHQTLGTNGTLTYESAMNLSGFIKVDGNYTVSWNAARSGAYMRVSTYDDDKNFIARIVAQNTYTRSSYSNTHTGYIRINYENSYQLSDVQVNTGSTPLPYEPYGYKIPISSANTTTSVYLGETQTTRKIKKLVFDGTEEITLYSYPDVSRFSFNAGNTTMNGGLCTHYTWRVQSGGTTDHFYTNNSGNVFFFSTTISTVSDFKSYLAAQYAAGTPVCIWYVLASETTGRVNEPLMKIGSYADSISMEQTGIEIPTINGSNTFDVNTTVKPSNVYIEYK